MSEQPVYDYGADAAQPSGGDLAKLSALARQQREAEQAAAAAEEQLKKAQDALRDLSQRTIPDLMKDLGLAEFKTSEGFKVSIKEQLRVSVPKNRLADAIAWVENNGGEDLVKRAFHILFGRDEEKWAAKFMRDLAQRKKPLRVERNDWVESATLKAFLNGHLKKGTDVPLETFGGFIQKESVITLPE